VEGYLSLYTCSFHWLLLKSYDVLPQVGVALDQSLPEKMLQVFWKWEIKCGR